MSDVLPTIPDVPPPPPEAPAAPESTRPRRRGLVAGGIAVAIALVAGALVVVLTQGGGSAEAQPLALSFTQGQSESYAIHQTMDGNISSDLFGDMPLEMDVTQVVSWEVTSVADDGTATIELSVTEMSGSVNGVEVPAAAAQMPPFEIVIAPDGRIVSAGGFALGGAGQTQGFGFPGMGQLTPLLPDEGEAVAPGDTWTKEFSQDFPFGEGTIEYTTTSTYERNEDVDGTEAAVITTEMSIPLDFSFSFQELLDSLGDELVPAGATGIDALADASMSYSGSGEITQTSWVDLEAKALLRVQSSGDFDMSVTFSGVPGFDGEMAFTGTFTQELERR
jgi:hypothetical protein